MKKGLLISILFILFLICLPKNIVNAETYGDLTYTIAEGEVTITDCMEDVTSIDIPSEINGIPVKHIEDSAFRGCSSLVTIYIPDTITSIGVNTFYGCSSLEKVNIEDISAWCNIDFKGKHGSNPFTYATSLYINDNVVTDLVIPNGVTTIKSSVFYDCDFLTSVTIPNSVTFIGEGAFELCSAIQQISVPFIGVERGDGVFGKIFGISYYTSGGINYYKIPQSLKKVIVTDEKTIESLAFYDNKGNNDYIEEITILDGVTSIGDGAFGSCNSLKVLNLPNSVVSIGNNAFSECGLESIVIPESVESIGDSAFADCSYLTSVNLPPRITAISNGMFSRCSSLRNISISNNVLSIGEKAFYNCVSLESVKISESVTNIGTSSFLNCKSLKCVEIPKSVLSIGVSAFGGCSSLEEITLPFIGSQRGNSGVIDSVFGYIFGYVTSSSDATTDDTRQYYASTGYAYYHILASLKKVTITDETFVSYGAFYGCTNISDIIIESDVKGIGSRAFAYHYNLLNVTIKSNSPKFADSMVFYDTDFATLYGYEGSTVEEYATKNGIDFEPIQQVSTYELNGYIKVINNTIVVSVELNDTVTDECLHIALYSEKGQLVDYIIVPSYKPFNEMNVVFKDTSTSTYAKVFLWNGFTSMQPLAEAKKIDIIR